jgi:4'-phosphopantetheinyl transferase
MPLVKLVNEGTRAWGLWKITESEEELSAEMQRVENIPATLQHSSKRLEWLSGRVLTQCLLASKGAAYAGMVKNEHGKPSLKHSPYYISLTHSFPFVGAIIDIEKEVGIDLEQPKDKLLRVGPRVLSESELKDAGSDKLKHCIYWCSKEALIKIHGRKDLILAQNLYIEPFILASRGQILGRIIVNDDERSIPLYYQVFDAFVMVFN